MASESKHIIIVINQLNTTTSFYSHFPHEHGLTSPTSVSSSTCSMKRSFENQWHRPAAVAVIQPIASKHYRKIKALNTTTKKHPLVTQSFLHHHQITERRGTASLTPAVGRQYQPIN